MKAMPVSKAKMKANQKWNAKAYYRPTIYIPREFENALHQKAAAEGKTVSTYIQDLIKADLGIEINEEE